MDAAGVIYSSGADRSRILRITPDGAITTLVADPGWPGPTRCGSTTGASC